MTKEEILAMEVGIELDDVIHRQVLGKGRPSLIHPLPKYSACISAAWQVVEKIQEMKDSEGNQLLCCLKIHCDIPGDAWDIHWSYSELSTMNDGHKDHKLPLSWFSFPEAICKAALLAKLHL